MSYNDEELNNLEYELALKYDKRTYCQFYISLLKTKHNFIFTFFNKNDYNSKIMKINLFLFNSALYFTINELFFNDNNMNDIYNNEGSYNFEYQIPQILYSLIISSILNLIFKFMALSQRDIISFKSKKQKENIDQKIHELNNKLRKKSLFFNVFGFLLLLFMWYYLSMFCARYAGAQYHLIKDTLMSYGLSMIYPFGIYILLDYSEFLLYLKVKIKENIYF